MSTDIRTASVVSIYSHPLKGDAEAVMLGEALDPSIQQTSVDTDQPRLIPRISSATETVMDYMAAQYGLLALLGWDAADVARKRELLSRVVGLYRKSGTLRGIRAALWITGLYAEFLEWWQAGGSGVPFTYSVDLQIGQDGITADEYLSVLQLLDQYTPARSQAAAISYAVTVPESPPVADQLKAISFLTLGVP